MPQVTTSRADVCTIGELSRLTGVNIETIRYYEKIGLLPAPLRTEGGHRLYGPREQRTLAFVRRARELGFTLDQIRTLLELGAPGNATCAEVKEIAAQHLRDIRNKIADLKRLERLLASTIAKCSGRKVPECPVVDILNARSSPPRST
jgi:MerR family mercuric resistance operon transcriptional regulator